jgi:hypothetical protein
VRHFDPVILAKYVASDQESKERYIGLFFTDTKVKKREANGHTLKISLQIWFYLLTIHHKGHA